MRRRPTGLRNLTPQPPSLGRKGESMSPRRRTSCSPSRDFSRRAKKHASVAHGFTGPNPTPPSQGRKAESMSPRRRTSCSPSRDFSRRVKKHASAAHGFTEPKPPSPLPLGRKGESMSPRRRTSCSPSRDFSRRAKRYASAAHGFTGPNPTPPSQGGEERSGRRHLGRKLRLLPGRPRALEARSSGPYTGLDNYGGGFGVEPPHDLTPQPPSLGS